MSESDYQIRRRLLVESDGVTLIVTGGRENVAVQYLVQLRHIEFIRVDTKWVKDKRVDRVAYTVTDEGRKLRAHYLGMPEVRG